MAEVPFFDPPEPGPPPRLPAGPPRPRWAEPPEGVLGELVVELHSRFGSAATAAVHQIDRVTFVDATRAAVVFSVWTGPTPVIAGARGDAVLRDGRWLVARSTFCGLLARVGVPCP